MNYSFINIFNIFVESNVKLIKFVLPFFVVFAHVILKNQHNEIYIFASEYHLLKLIQWLCSTKAV